MIVEKVHFVDHVDTKNPKTSKHIFYNLLVLFSYIVSNEVLRKP